MRMRCHNLCTKPGISQADPRKETNANEQDEEGAERSCMCSLDFRGGPPLQLPPGTNLTIICSDSSSQTVSVHGAESPAFLPNGSELHITGCNVQTIHSWAAGGTELQQLEATFFGGASRGVVHLDASTLLCPLQVC